MTALGVTAGVFDLTMILPDGRHAYLEAKSERGRLSEEQQWFRLELIKRNVPHVIFRSLADIRGFHFAARHTEHVGQATGEQKEIHRGGGR
jgi:hypothetical protein